MKITSRFIYMRTIEVDNDLLVDIILDTKENVYETWLYHPGYGIKEFMYGEPIHNQRFGQPITITLDEVIENIAFNVEEYMNDYIDTHMGG